MSSNEQENTEHPVVIHLDAEETKAFLEGKEIVTVDMLRQATPQSKIGRMIKKLAE